MLVSQDKKSIVIVPTVYVNNVAERGGISTAAVLSTICAGYKPGTEPDVSLALEPFAMHARVSSSILCRRALFDLYSTFL